MVAVRDKPNRVALVAAALERILNDPGALCRWHHAVFLAPHRQDGLPQPLQRPYRIVVGLRQPVCANLHTDARARDRLDHRAGNA